MHHYQKGLKNKVSSYGKNRKFLLCDRNTIWKSCKVSALWKIFPTKNLLHSDLKEFIKLNVNMDMMTKKCKICGMKYNYCECYLEYANVIDGLIEYKCFFAATKTTISTLMKIVKTDLLIHLNLLAMISESLFICYENLFTCMNIWMIGKNHILNHVSNYMKNETWFLCSKRYILISCCIKNFRNTCLEIYDLDLILFITAPALAWEAALKKAKVKLDL